MFGKKEKSSTFGQALVLNLIGEGTEIKGNIKCDSDLRIDGKVIGNVSTHSKLVLGAAGSIEGNVKARSGDVSGVLKGDVVVDEILFIKASGRVDGNISTSKMVIESGGEFNGNCSMQANLDSE